MTDDLKEFDERYERRQSEMQRRMLAIPGSRRDLGVLVREGADEKKVLDLLYSITWDATFWCKPVRKKKRELEDIAHQLEMVANHAERISLDPLSYGTLWTAILGFGKWEHVRPAAERSPKFIFGLMRLYAKNCKEKAKAFGKLLRDHTPRQRHWMLDCLLVEVWRKTGKYHDAELARLVTDAFEAAGRKNRQFTEDQIKKHRQRHVTPRIKLHQERVASPISIPAEKGTMVPLTF
jgi:hypothetical protein